MSEQHAQQRQAAGQKITIIGAIANILLSIIKIFAGLISGSIALVADGFHSLADLISDFAVIVLFRVANKKPDSNHPWGHARFETLGSIFVAVLLAAVGIGILYQAAVQLTNGELASIPGWLALIVAAVSLIAKEILYQYTVIVGRKYNSKLLIANAWHHRTDMFTSALVFVAIGGAMLGWWWLDALGAILVSLLLMWLAIKMLWESLSELVDTALPEDEVETIRQQALDAPGVLSIRNLKTRRSGPHTLVEMHIQVPERVTAAEGHHIGREVSKRLKASKDDLTHLIYHIDVEQGHPEKTQFPELPKPDDIRYQVIDMLSKQDPRLNENNVEVDLYMRRRSFDIDIKLPSQHNLGTNAKQNVTSELMNMYADLNSVDFYQRIS